MDNLNQAIERYRSIPKLNLVNLNTPIEKLERIKNHVPGCPNLYIKRDDFIGYVCGGNKVRKLEYVMADVLKKKATAVVTVGGVYSNHARITAMIARRLGLKCSLILNGEIPDKPNGNFYLNKLMNIDIHNVQTRNDRNGRMDELAAELENKGERVYKVPLGSSYPIGSFGFVAALEEVLQQQKLMGIEFDAILIGSSSGGTQAGLEVGKRLFNKPELKIMGISPDDPGEQIKGYMMDIITPMLEQLGLNLAVDKSDLWVDEKYFGEGYGESTEKSKEATKIFCDIEGILVDPVYTSKTAAALIDYCQQNVFNPDDNVLFWHTGGIMTFFV